MFQDIKEQLLRDNIIIIKQQMQMLNRQIQGRSDLDQEIEDNQEFKQRVHIFNHIMDDSQPQNHKIMTKNTQFNKYLNLLKQYQLLQQKMNIQQQTKMRQLQYLTQKHDQQLLLLKAQLEKYKCRQAKTVKQQNTILSLKKDNRHLHELMDQKDKMIQQLLHQKSVLKKQVTFLQKIVKEKQQTITGLQTQKHVQSQSQKKLKEEVLLLKQQKTYESDRKKQLENSLQKIRQENDDLIRELNSLKIQKQHQKQSFLQRTKAEIIKLQEQNKDLRRRNQKLQESFIQHLTQTSLNLQQSFKNQPERTNKNSSLYLNQTPIKHRSQRKQRVPTHTEEQDPEKSHICGQKCPCSSKMKDLKTKLQKANNVIVQLLQQKGQRKRLL